MDAASLARGKRREYEQLLNYYFFTVSVMRSLRFAGEAALGFWKLKILGRK
jgi:subtilisin-like proprotein convertase family protein